MSKDSPMRIFKAVCLFLIIIGVPLEVGVIAQPSKKMSEQVWFNVPSAPLEIRLSPSKRDLELFNRSFGRAIGYRLGCVRQDSSIKVLQKLPYATTDLEPGKMLINSVSQYANHIEHCRRENAMVSVVEVRFE